MGKATIEWTDRSANPIRAGHKATGKVEMFFDPKPMDAVIRMRKPGQKISLCDMTDLFADVVTDEMIDHAFAYMASAGRQVFQVLTKRPGRAARWFARVSERGVEAADKYTRELRELHMQRISGYQEGFSLPSPPTSELRFIYDSACVQERDRSSFHRNTKPWGHGFSGGEYHWRKWPLDNVWIGTSVEDQRRADERIPELLKVPAAVRFLSVEPLLGPIDLTEIGHGDQRGLNALSGEFRYYRDSDGEPCSDWGAGIDWIIVGGESGRNARPCDFAWIRSIRDQCKAAGVSFFCKQLGSNCHGYWLDPGGPGDGICHHSSERGWKLRDPKGGDIEEIPHDLRIREFPKAHAEAMA